MFVILFLIFAFFEISKNTKTEAIIHTQRKDGRKEERRERLPVFPSVARRKFYDDI